jgi:hypothetical protein
VNVLLTDLNTMRHLDGRQALDQVVARPVNAAEAAIAEQLPGAVATDVCRGQDG